MDKIRQNGPLLIGVALFYLSTVLLFAIFEVKNVRKDLPALMSQFETMEPKVDIASIITSVNGISDQIPDILKEVEETRKTMDSINKQMPAILDEVAALRTTTIPSVVKESAAIRADAPAMLDKADKVATKLEKIPENMTRGVATGTVKSVIQAPSDIVKGVGKGVGEGFDFLTGGSKKPPVESTTPAQ